MDFDLATKKTRVSNRSCAGDVAFGVHSWRHSGVWKLEGKVLTTPILNAVSGSTLMDRLDFAPETCRSVKFEHREFKLSLRF